MNIVHPYLVLKTSSTHGSRILGLASGPKSTSTALTLFQAESMFQAKSTVYLPGYIRECHKVSFDLWKICLSCPLSIALSLTLHIQTEILCSFRGVPRIYNIMALSPSLSNLHSTLHNGRLHLRFSKLRAPPDF